MTEPDIPSETPAARLRAWAASGTVENPDVTDVLAYADALERNQRALEFLREGPFGRITAMLPQSSDAAVIRILEGGEAYPPGALVPRPVHVSYVAGASDEDIELAKRAVVETVVELLGEQRGTDVPERERLVHDNPALAGQVREGIAEAERGETVDLGSFARHLDEGDDDVVVARITDLDAVIRKWITEGSEYEDLPTSWAKVTGALTAILDRHKPVPAGVPNKPHLADCAVCMDVGPEVCSPVGYPCETVEDIARALGVIDARS